MHEKKIGKNTQKFMQKELEELSVRYERNVVWISERQSVNV